MKARNKQIVAGVVETAFITVQAPHIPTKK
jgi:hypothetical protein